MKIHVFMRTSNSHRETSPLWSTSYETHTVALEKQLEGTRITRKGDTHSQVAPPSLRWWLEESSVLPGQPLHSLKHSLQIFTDTSKEGWGAHLNEHTARGTWSVPESNKSLGAKSGLSDLKRVPRPLFKQHRPGSHRQHNSGCLYQQRGGMKSGSLCALLWRILSWCTRTQITLKACHIPSRLNVIANKLSRLGQTIQTEWSLHPEVFKAICSRWHQPQVDLFATRFNNKLPPFVYRTPRHGQWMHSVCHCKNWTHMPSHQQPSWAK